MPKLGHIQPVYKYMGIVINKWSHLKGNKLYDNLLCCQFMTKQEKFASRKKTLWREINNRRYKKNLQWTTCIRQTALTVT